MSSRIERRTPREDFLVAMFQDDPRLVAELRRTPDSFNWSPITIIAALALVWGGIALAWLWRKGWL